MNTSLTGKGILDTLAGSLTALLSNALGQMFGPDVLVPRFGNVSWADLGVSFSFALLVALVNGMANSLVRRQIRQSKAPPEFSEWRTQLWQTVGRPIYLLIWVYGAYLTATPILLKLSAATGTHPIQHLFDKLFDLGGFVVMVWLLLKLAHILEARLKSLTRTTASKLDDMMVPLVARTLRVIIPVVGLILALPMIGLPAGYASILAKSSSILIVGAVGYVLFQGVALGEKAALAQYDIKAADNLQARKVLTQVRVLSKALYVIIAIFSAASILMLFDEVRQFGTSILASAGVVGIIIGFAAQRTIANLFAGFQLAMTQPIRLDDVVIVEGEWGRVEDITLTYVVICIWDERRLIVPLSHFIEKPFQNWTRVSANILGSVMFWADYTIPIGELRAELQRILEGCGDWDRRFWNLQVTDTTERAVQLRVLATAADASKAWNLRCEIREKLLTYVQKMHPQGLPKLRATLSQDSIPLSNLVRVPQNGPAQD